LVLRDPIYASAERFITETIVQAQKAQEPVMPHEVVEKLQKQGVSADVGSSALWEMIGTGEVELSKDWRLTTRTHRSELATS
jgi:hypothetical protein